MLQACPAGALLPTSHPHLGGLVLQGGLEQGGKVLGGGQAAQVGGRQVAHLGREEGGRVGGW